jgi:hypothetical protein
MYTFDTNEETTFNLDVSRGYYSSLRAVHLFGFNRTVETGYETLFNDGGGLYLFPTQATVISCVSSSTDTKQLYIEGLNDSYHPISEVVTLTGTTPVTTSKLFYRVNRALLLDGVNAGNITLTCDSKTVAYIEAGSGISSAAIYTTPADCKLYIHGVSFSSGTVNPNKYLTGRASMRTGSQELHFWNSSWAVGFLQFDVKVPFTIPPMTDISFDAKSSSGNNEISMYGNCILESTGWITDAIKREWQ